MTAIDIHTTVGQMVTDRPSRSRVFQKLGIDFCCGGKKSLEEVCKSKGLDARTVLDVLLASEAAPAASAGANPAEMGLTELCDHIETTHHAYLNQELPRLGAMVRKVAAVHGDRHPWMVEVNDVFSSFAAELDSHMMKEEQVLFKLIRGLEKGRGEHSIQQPLHMMEHEHDDAGQALEQMRKLTSDYTPPAGACNTFRAMLDGLAELEADMHQHVHKENNILFPRALELEQQRAATPN